MKDACIYMNQLLWSEGISFLRHTLGSVLLIFSIIIFKIDGVPGWTYFHFDPFVTQAKYKIHFLFSKRGDEYISQIHITYGTRKIKRSASRHAHNCFASDHSI